MMRDAIEIFGEGVCLTIGPSRGEVRIDVETWDGVGDNREHRSATLDDTEMRGLILKLRRAKSQAARQAKQEVESE